MFDLEKRPLEITVLVYEQESDKARALMNRSSFLICLTGNVSFCETREHR